MRVVVAPSSFVQAPHRHDGPRLIIYLAGSYVERSFGERAVFLPGDFCIRPQWYAHDGASSRGAHYAHLDFTEKGVRRFFSKYGWRAWRGRVSLDHLPDLVGHPGGGDALLATASVRPMDDHINDALHAVARNLDGESDVALKDIAEAIGLAPWTLSRRFSRVFGMTPSTFRLQARLQRAMRMLAETDVPAAAIAAQSGFADQSHFAHALKRVVGLTPTAVRRRLALS